MLSPNELKLSLLLRDRAFRTGHFKLASGASSGYYIDGRMVSVCSEGAHLIGEVFYERTKDLGIDAVGGLQAGAIPLVTAAVMSYHQHGRSLEGFWVREEAKGHGTRKAIEGKLDDGWRVAIVDDVVTTGNSILKVAEVVRALKCEIALVFALADRGNGTADLFRSRGVHNFYSLFTPGTL